MMGEHPLVLSVSEVDQIPNIKTARARMFSFHFMKIKSILASSEHKGLQSNEHLSWKRPENNLELLSGSFRAFLLYCNVLRCLPFMYSILVKQNPPFDLIVWYGWVCDRSYCLHLLLLNSTPFLCNSRAQLEYYLGLVWAKNVAKLFRHLLLSAC